MQYTKQDWEQLKNLLLGTGRALGYVANNYKDLTINDLGERLQNVENLLDEAINKFIAQVENTEK